MELAARLLASLACLVPRLPVAMAVNPATVDRYMQTTPESQTLAIVREGLLTIPSLDNTQVMQRFQQMGIADHGAMEGAEKLVRHGASEELVRAFAEATRSVQEQVAGDTEDRARSAAERFLYELVETLPETTGQFEMNGRLDFRFGNADIEVDLLARDLRLAIEVDGYYHFRDPDAYRRDRRKDWELQRHGFLVLRFLADDVVVRMEEILDIVRASVEYSRQQEGLLRSTANS
jgi:hypothetical protein